jgi:hypothetical protein
MRIGGVEVHFHAFFTSELDGGEWSAWLMGWFTSRERAPGTHWIGDWVGSRAGLDAVVSRRILSPYRDSNPDHAAHSPALYRLYTREMTMYVCASLIYLVWFVVVSLARSKLNTGRTEHHETHTESNCIESGLLLVVRHNTVELTASLPHSDRPYSPSLRQRSTVQAGHTTRHSSSVLIFRHI